MSTATIASKTRTHNPLEPTGLPQDVIDGGLEPDGRATLGSVIDALLTGLDEIGIQPLNGSVSAGGFTIAIRGHALRVGFSTDGAGPGRYDPDQLRRTESALARYDLVGDRSR